MIIEENIKVSFFKNYFAKRCRRVDLKSHLLSTEWKNDVIAIRREPDKRKRDKMKMILPAITPSGIFKRHNSSGIVKYSGFICMDIDAKDNPSINNWEALKSTISNLPGLWYCGLSASGNGLFALFRVKYPERHKEHFTALSMDLRNHGIIIDESGKDICRLRGVSFDENPIFNPDVAMYEKLIKISEVCKIIHEQSTIITEQSTIITEVCDIPLQVNLEKNDERTARNVQKLVEKIQSTGTDITDYYPNWFFIGCSIASEFGEFGRNWYHIVSAQSLKYKPDECNRQYNKCLRCSKISISTFFHFCKQFGITLNSISN